MSGGGKRLCVSTTGTEVYIDGDGPGWQRAAARFVGELALDGTVRHVRGVLPIAAFAREREYRRLYVPETDAGEAALIPGPEVIPVRNLLQLVDHLTEHEVITPQATPVLAGVELPGGMDYSEIT